MALLTYTAITSLDGFDSDEQGNFDWSVPDAEVHAFVNDLDRPVGTYLFGRRVYHVLSAWENLADEPGLPDVELDFARHWQLTDKIVYSRTLLEAPTARTRIERAFEPDAVRELKRTAVAELSIGGANLASQAIAAGLVDEIRLFLSPVLIGAGNRALPKHFRSELELLDQRRFGNGVVFLRYRVRG